MNEKRFSESLVCTLTPGEVAERADRAARLQFEADEIEGKTATESKLAKDKVKGLDAVRRRLLNEVRTRQGFRAVECAHIPDYVSGTLRTVRLDTGELLRSRSLTPEERQDQMFAIDEEPEHDPREDAEERYLVDADGKDEPETT